MKIISSEKICQDPALVVNTFSETYQIPYSPDHLHWWHDEAIRSTGFQTLRTYAVDLEGKPTFAEIKHPFDMDIIHQIYLENFHYYEKFLQAKSNT